MQSRNQMIDILKIIFVIAIFCCHLNSLSQPKEKVELFMHLGFLGVEFFFIVSGYFMFSKLDRIKEYDISNETIKFILHKISIFFPYYIFAYIIGFIVLHYQNKIQLNMLIKDLVMSIPSILQLQISGIKCYQALTSTWYLSAMILSMCFLFPIVFKLKSTFSKIIAPLIVVFIYGYLSLNIGNLATIDPINGGVVYTGLLRGIAGISLGCSCFEIAKYLREYKLSNHGKKIITYLEILLYFLILYLMNYKATFRLDFIIVLLFIIALSITFSNQSYTKNIIHKEYLWIGKLSLIIFLVDPIARSITRILLPMYSRNERILPCIVILILLSILTYIGGDKVKRISYNLKNILKRIILA